MLRFEDCLELSGLNENELRTISRRLRVPDVVACAIGSSITHRPTSAKSVNRMSTPAPTGIAKRHIAPALQITRNDRRRLNDLLDRVAPRGVTSVARFLDAELSRAAIVEAHAIDPSTVTMRSRVLYKHHDSQRVHFATLTYPGELVKPSSAISILSKTGIALLGLAEGESMHWRQNNWWRGVTVLRVVYQPEACGRADQ